MAYVADDFPEIRRALDKLQGKKPAEPAKEVAKPAASGSKTPPFLSGRVNPKPVYPDDDDDGEEYAWGG